MIEALKEFSKTTEQLIKGYEVLQTVEEIDVATAPKKLVWQEDKVRLFHYENPQATCPIPILISYALVNRFDMMDLQPDRSLIRKLLSLGMDIYVVDWGYPTRTDRYLTLNDYITGYIDDCVDFIRQEHNIEKVNLLGVCQGGTFSLIYSALHPNKVQNLVTLVTPVDFSVEDGLLFKWSRHLDIDKIVDSNGGLVPGDFLNFAFDMLKPTAKMKKMQAIPDLFDDKAKLMNYLRMEQWVADSPAQAGECFRQFIKDLYQQNKLMKGELVIGNRKVNLKNVTMPILTIYAAEDHLVPPSATKPLNDLVGSTDKTLFEFPGGHIGVFVGARSQKELGPTIAKWYNERVKK
jgi:polyhydroxyalkanoate synthase subunit PhaC